MVNAHAVRPAVVQIVGDHGAPGCHEMRDLVERFLDTGAREGR